MTRPCAKGLWLVAALGVSGLLLLPALAPAAVPAVARVSAEAGAVVTNAGPRCPVDTFREVLLMEPAERERYLASRPLPSRKLMEGKLKEYESISPTQRELRLRATELYWYLLPLLTTPPTNRAAQYALIPTEVRTMVADRIEKWDALPDDAKARLLGKINRDDADPGDPPGIAPPLPPQVREDVERGIRQWRELNEQERQQIADRFYHFLELTPRERERTIRRLSAPERSQIEKTLGIFAGLNPDQRAVCFESLEKFASLSLEEREQFMQNAQRWEQMSPEERRQLTGLIELLAKRTPSPVVRLIRIPRPPSLATNRGE
jgi:hypothetical protein